MPGHKAKRHETQKIRKRDKKRIEFLVAWIVLTAYQKLIAIDHDLLRGAVISAINQCKY